MATGLFRSCLNHNAKYQISRLFAGQRVTRQASTESKTSVEKTLKPISEIPTPKEHSLKQFYDMAKRQDEMHLYFDDIIRKYGPITAVKFGGVTYVFVSDLAAVEQIFRHEGKYPDRVYLPLWEMQRKEMGEPLSLQMLSGENWWRQRRCVNKVFLNTHKIAATVDDINAVNEDFIHYLKTNIEDGASVVMDKYIKSWITEMSWAVLYQRRLGCLQENLPSDAEDIMYAMTTFFEVNNSLYLLPPKYAKVFMRKKYNTAIDCTRILFRLGRTSIEDMQAHLESGNADSTTRTGILTNLMEATKDIEGGLSEKELNATMAELMSAAIDTTRNSVLCLIDEIARRPDVQTRIHTEVSEVASYGENPSTGMLQNTPFLRACVKEVLRLYPPAFMIPRILQADTEILGYMLPKGTQVSIPVYSLSMDDNVYEKAAEFYPDRWLRDERGSRKIKSNPFAFLPFGHGVRGCAGRRLAELEMHAFLFKMIQNFTFEAESRERLKMRSRTLLVPNREIRVKMKHRKNE